MTIARKLAQAGKKVFLFEGGGEEISEESQNIYKGKVVAKGCKYRPLDIVRLRFLGGTSNHWAGQCFPMHEDIFEGRKNIPNGEWTIKKQDLDIYAKEAQHILEISYRNTNKEFFFNDPKYFLIKRVTADRSSVNFRIKYYDKLKNNQNLFVFLNSNLMNLDTNGEKIVSARFSNYQNESRKIYADKFVLATGGIENSRLLLYNNIKNKGKLVKNPRTLGKYYMDHLDIRNVGILCLFNKMDRYIENWNFYYLEEKFRERSDLLDVNIFPVSYRNEGVLISFLKKMKNSTNMSNKKDILLSFIKEITNSTNMQDKENTLLPFIKELQDLTNIPNIEKSTFSELNIYMEMEPEIHNAITLGNKVDYFGIPTVELSIAISKKVKHTQSFIYKFLAERLIKDNFGRIKIKPSIWQENFENWLAGFHHLGGTRMAETNEWGIVDKNCLVFGQKNLYIAGSSVFPSGAAINPTYTIVQLALRLADHLLALRA